MEKVYISKLRELGYTVHDYPEHVAIGMPFIYFQPENPLFFSFVFTAYKTAADRPNSYMTTSTHICVDVVTPNIVFAIFFHICQLDRCLIIISYYLWPPLSGLETYLAFFQGRVGPEVDATAVLK